MDSVGLSSLESKFYYKPFAATVTGFIVPMVTGTLSACSSALIIYIISRSQQKLSTTYHRIMAFMSAFDIISSIFIALGTVMAPSDTIYKFAGPILGNKVTCQIQGWLVVFGLCGSTSLNACLTWYFVCSIVFKMDSIRMTHIIEPFMHVYALFLACYVPSFYLSNDLLNPNPYDSFCTVVPYPESCEDQTWYDWSNCTWSEASRKDLLHYKRVSTAVIGLQSALIVLGMSIIVWSVYKTDRKIKMRSSVSNDTDHTLYPEIIHLERENNIIDMKYSNAIKIQALLYIMAFVFTWLLTFFSGCFNVASFELDAINCILFPLQGFWNLIIFFYDKTYIIRQSDCHMSFIDAAKQIVVSPSKIQSVLFYNLSAVLEESNLDSDMEQCEHLEKGNRIFTSKKCIRRSGYIKDIRQQESNSILSIQTPKGFVGDSITSTKSRKESKDITADVLECFNAQISSSVNNAKYVKK